MLVKHQLVLSISSDELQLVIRIPLDDYQLVLSTISSDGRVQHDGYSQRSFGRSESARS